MDIKIVLTAIIAIALSSFVSGCYVSKQYHQPPVNTDGLYRTVTKTDTVSIASIPPKQLFNNPYLQDLLQAGIDSNYDLKVAIARIKQTTANLRQTKAAFYPAISIAPEVTLQKTSSAQGDIAALYPTRIYEVYGSASWEIDLWGKLRSSKRSALAQLLASEAYRRLVQTQIVAEIATDYYNLLAYDKQLAITRQTVVNRAQDVETNKALKEANRNVTEASVAQSEANRYAAEVTIPDLQNGIRQTENAICLLLGRQPGAINRDSLGMQQPDSSLQTGIPAQLLGNRPDVQQAEFTVRSYFEQINKARAYFYPAFTITANGGWQSVTLDKLLNPAGVFASAVGALTQPIFNQGLNKQRLQVAQAQYEENVATFRKTFLTAGQEVSNALYSYQSAQDKREVRALQLAAWKRAVDYNRELLKSGYATYTDVLTSEQGYLAAQLNSINDKLQQLTAVVSLYKSLGGGWK